MKKHQGVDYTSAERIKESISFLDNLENILSFPFPLNTDGNNHGDIHHTDYTDNNDTKMNEVNTILSSYKNLLVPPNVDYSADDAIKIKINGNENMKNKLENEFIASASDRRKYFLFGDNIGDKDKSRDIDNNDGESIHMDTEVVQREDGDSQNNDNGDDNKISEKAKYIVGGTSSGSKISSSQNQNDYDNNFENVSKGNNRTKGTKAEFNQNPQNKAFQEKFRKVSSSKISSILYPTLILFLALFLPLTCIPSLLSTYMSFPIFLLSPFL